MELLLQFNSHCLDGEKKFPSTLCRRNETKRKKYLIRLYQSILYAPSLTLCFNRRPLSECARACVRVV